MAITRMWHRVVLVGLLVLLPWSVAWPAEEAAPDPEICRKLVREYADYLALPAAKRAETPEPSFDHPPLSKADAERWRSALWQAWVEYLREERDEKLKALGDPRTSGRGAVRAVAEVAPGQQVNYTMRFFMRVFGKKPKGGWPLYINLHSGGNNKAMNDRSWALTKSQYPIKVGLYVAPRSVMDTAESWYEPNNYPLLERLLAEAYALWDVDPNRVYLMGYSMGGWGVFHLGPAMPDSWAAVAASAGAGFTGPTGRSAADNLRNTPMMIQIGEKDTAFNRQPLSKAFAEVLQALHKSDPDGYIVRYKEHKGKGHAINDRDTPGWLSKFTRNPLPPKVVWQQIVPPPGTPIRQIADMMQRNLAYAEHYRHRLYWLQNDSPGPFQRVVARRDGNTIHLEETKYLGPLTILLDDRMADLDQPVTVVSGETELVKQVAPRTVNTLLRTLVPRGDPGLVFSAALPVRAPDMAARLEETEPKTAEQHLERADYRIAHGRIDAGVEDLHAALKLAPEQGPKGIFLMLLRLAQRQKNAGLVLDTYRRWAVAEPENARIQAAFAYQCISTPEKDLRDPKTALQHARKAADLTRRSDPAVMHLLALTMFTNAMIEEAVETQKKAIKLLPEKTPKHTAEAFQAALKRYEAVLKREAEE